jgi:hypothetical protein
MIIKKLPGHILLCARVLMAISSQYCYDNIMRGITNKVIGGASQRTGFAVTDPGGQMKEDLFFPAPLPHPNCQSRKQDKSQHHECSIGERFVKAEFVYINKGIWIEAGIFSMQQCKDHV